MSNVDDCKEYLAKAWNNWETLKNTNSRSWQNFFGNYYRGAGKIDKKYHKQFNEQLKEQLSLLSENLMNALSEDITEITSLLESLINLVGRMDNRDLKYYFHNPEKDFKEDIDKVGQILEDVFKVVEPLNSPISPTVLRPVNAIVPPSTDDKTPIDYQYDVFISHANEDKDYVTPLVVAFKNQNIRCWYDEYSIEWGDSLVDKINTGIANSKYVIVFISLKYLEKYWTKAEYGGAVARESKEGKVILPIWHKIDPEEIKKKYPILADKLAMDFSEGVDEIVKKLRAILDKP